MYRKHSHFRKHIPELLEGRLVRAAQLELDKHLSRCQDCRDEFEILRWIRQSCVGHLEVKYAGYSSEKTKVTHVSRTITSSDRPSMSLGERSLRLSLSCLGLLLSLWVVGLGYDHWKSPELTAEVAHDFRNLKEAKLKLEFHTSSPQILIQLFRDAGIPFRIRISDLSSHWYPLMGGRIHQLANCKSTLCVYRSDANKILLCQMYWGKIEELGRGWVVLEEGGISFRIYHLGSLTMACWRDGEVICLLASEISAEELIRLVVIDAATPYNSLEVGNKYEQKSNG